MAMNSTIRTLIILCLLLLSAFSCAQVLTGTPPFNSFGGSSLDMINLGNLNIHVTIPIVSRPGRGLPFNYSLTYDSSIWYPTGSSGSESWQTVNNDWGWSNQSEGIPGYVNFQTSSSPCYANGHQIGAVAYIGPWTYYAPDNTTHLFSGELINVGNCPGTNVTSFTSVATDNSGLTLQVTNNGTNVLLIRPNGVQIAVPKFSTGGSGTASAVSTDTNGNQITSTGTVQSLTYTDTLNVSALAISGYAPNNVLLTYPGPSGNVSTTLSYTTYTIKTNFGCLDSGGHAIAEYTSTGTVPLLTAIILPDDTAQVPHRYTITYEETPGYSSSYSTGRIASITTPNGGVISYTYTGGSNGVVCSDGSTAGLMRFTSDGDSQHYWNYSRTQTSQAPNPIRWQTTTTNPQSDQSIYTFEVVSSNFYEEQRKVHTNPEILYDPAYVLISMQHCVNYPCHHTHTCKAYRAL